MKDIDYYMVIKRKRKTKDRNLYVHAQTTIVVGFLVPSGNAEYVKNGLVQIVMR